MRVSSLFYYAFRTLAFPAFVATLILYLFPPLFECEFPTPVRPVTKCYFDQRSAREAEIQAQKEKAPFRLLTIADPQLEGDTSLPNPGHPIFPSVSVLRSNFSIRAPLEAVYTLSTVAQDLVTKDVPQLLWSYRKRLDLLGNDLYLAHIYRLVHWWSDPTHVTVLGDLLGSQWISDEEFQRRGWRFWNRVFRNGKRIEDHVTVGGRQEILGEDPAWRSRIISVVGNHDIGYAGDITYERMDRFEKAYGRVNWDVTFRLPQDETWPALPNPFKQDLPPELQLIILNSMNLDGPSYVEQFQQETYQYLNERVIPSLRSVEDLRTATIVLTHIPLYKRDGLCTDGPYIAYSETGVREQNLITQAVSESLLQGIFGKSLNPNAPLRGHGRNGIILNGHDHEGCNVYHFINRSAEDVDGSQTSSWAAKLWPEAYEEFEDEEIPGIREITVRSIMGDFSGTVGFLSAWFDDEVEEWRFAYSSCSLGVQHFWWGVHIADIVVVLIMIGWIVSLGMEARKDYVFEQEVLRRLEKDEDFAQSILKESSESSAKSSSVLVNQSVIRRAPVRNG